MESIHGVDISWLHHSNKGDRNAQSSAPPTPKDAVTGSENHSTNTRSSSEEDGPTKPHMNGDTTAQARHTIHRPHLHHRQSSEKSLQSAQSSPQSPRDIKPNTSPSLGRKPSWISNISSKFSSSNTPPPSSPLPTSSAEKPLPSPRKDQLNNVGGTTPSSPRDLKVPDAAAQQPQISPKSGAPSFLQSALRRLSASSASVGLGKAATTGGTVPRRVMNVDPYRDRARVQDLQTAKLRRVAFCVDVEIAGTARYLDEDDGEKANIPPPAPSLNPSVSDDQADDKKQKNKKIKERMEGEALKHPQAVIETKETTENPTIIDETAPADTGEKAAAPAQIQSEECKDPNRKKEKKKRSEEERKQRKERKKQEAVANGTVPVELSRSSSSGENSSPNGRSRSKAQDRPTTDPLRIYRRCCQLRETQILKRITEQIGSTSACDPTSPGTISCLDLSGYWMLPHDIVTLGDYLAVVPVKKLILENCDLTDETLRVLLAGLLAAKTPEQARHNKHLARKSNCHDKEAAEHLGVIEKLSLKNNPHIGINGWKYIGCFIHMSRSLKAIDLSMIPIPQKTKPPTAPGKPAHTGTEAEDPCSVLQKALAQRLAGPRLEELVMAECKLTTEHIEKIVEGVIECGATRLGLAGNNIDQEALKLIARYVRTGKCEGLDLGGNNLSNDLDVLADALDEKNALYALSLADCSLEVSSLKTLFPALLRLPNFRFIDLSHNRNLFAIQPNALSLLRKFLPQMTALKRIHLADVAMSSEHAIAIAEVLPESHNLAHLNILENPQLSALASAKDEASQEEACALYASLMAAVRVSDSIVCIDIDVPSQDSSEIVKALAKQVVAYSLRNMERGPVAEAYAAAGASFADPYVAVPDILLHLVGHIDGYPENHDNDEPAPDDDYIVGGTGVVKALGVCLGNRAADHRRTSKDGTPADSGTTTPVQSLQGTEMAKGKAKVMSKNLLGSARKIRARLQPALVREARVGDDAGYRRLQFLDSTLERMIQRFEDEYPDCRLAPPAPIPSADQDALSDPDTVSPSTSFKDPFASSDLHHPTTTTDTHPDTAEEDEDADASIRPMSRQHSDVSLASRYLTREEGQMHRFGQKIRRDILRPEAQDYAHGTTGHEVEAGHLRRLRHTLEQMDGAEIKRQVESRGGEAVLRELGATAEELLLLQKEDPEGFEMFKEAQAAAEETRRWHLGGAEDGDGGEGGEEEAVVVED